MPQYLRPGAYTERVDAAPPDRAVLRSDVAAFVGIAEKGPLDTSVPIQSFRQFQTIFGQFIGAGYLAYSLRAFFDNGGRRCWVVRVASRSFGGPPGSAARAGEVTIAGAGGTPLWTIRASSEGSWGNALEAALLEESAADTAIAAGHLHAFFARVATTAGFVRGSLVRISQEDSAGTLRDFYRVVSFVDEQRQRLYWMHPQPGMGLAYDRALENFDGNRPARITSVSYRIDVYRNHELLAIYSGLSLVPEHPDYAPARLGAYKPQQKAGTGAADVPEPLVVVALGESPGIVPERLQITPLQRIPLLGGQDGLNVLSHLDFIGADFSPRDSDLQRRQKNRGIACLNQVDEITLVAVPDIVIQPDPEPEYRPETPPPPNPCLPCPPPPEPTRAFSPLRPGGEQPPVFSDAQIFQVQAALVAHCEKRGDRFAVIDPPHHIASDLVQGIAAIRAWRNRFDSSYAALYYPWVKVIDPRREGDLRTIPPCGHALGQYALMDNDTGVHRAPANRALQWLQDLSLHTSYGQQELFNPLGINLLRSEGSRGLRIMGARTTSSDPDWIHINIRRLLIMIRRTLDTLSQRLVFEPNHARTRNLLQLAISSYLAALWASGALAGATREQAFFVKCDEENNPPQQRNNGQLLAEVGVAPSVPFEFIVVRIGIQENELTFMETGSAREFMMA